MIYLDVGCSNPNNWSCFPRLIAEPYQGYYFFLKKILFHVAHVPKNVSKEIQWLDQRNFMKRNVLILEKTAQIITSLGVLITLCIRKHSKHLLACHMRTWNSLSCFNLKTNDFWDDSSIVLILGCLKICLEQIYFYSVFW